MKAAAIIHARTYYNDFHPELLVKPENFTSSDVSWAKKYIVNTTNYCDDLNGIRWVAFNNESYCIFGIVGILESLFLQYQNNIDYKSCVYDQNGRNIKCFLGFVIKKDDWKKGFIPNVQLQDFVSLFDNYVLKTNLWISQELGQKISNYTISLEAKEYQGKLQGNGLLEHTPEKAKELFEYVLWKNSINQEIWLCTNIYNLAMLKKGKMQQFTAPSHVIKQYENEQKISSNKETNLDEIKLRRDDRVKKKGVYAASVSVLIVIIICVLMIKLV